MFSLSSSLRRISRTSDNGGRGGQGVTLQEFGWCSAARFLKLKNGRPLSEQNMWFPNLSQNQTAVFKWWVLKKYTQFLSPMEDRKPYPLPDPECSNTQSKEVRNHTSWSKCIMVLVKMVSLEIWSKIYFLQLQSVVVPTAYGVVVAFMDR